MNIEHQKNFERWIKERIKVEVTDRERQLLLIMYEYCVNRIEAKDNRINNLELQVKQLQADLKFTDECWRDYMRGS
jgi:hypothetical protein